MGIDPYSRFSSLRTFLVISGLTLTLAGGRYFRDQLPVKREEFVEYIIIIIYASIPFIIWALVVYVVLPLILENTFFRKFVLGRRYIEGTWFQWADEPGDKLGLSILDIQPNYDSFVIAGRHFVILEDHFDPIPKSFSIQQIKFEWPTLFNCYSTTPIPRIGESEDTEGLGHMTFTSQNGAPKRYHGTYSYGGLHGRVAVEGRRATDEEIKALYEPDRRQALISKLVVEFTRDKAPSIGLATSMGDGGKS